jgi:bifunctional non-homologous end joining protein LigD
VGDRQLSLPLTSAADRAPSLPAQIKPMLPADVAAPFDDPAYLFEPWWPGLRLFAFVERGAVRLQAGTLSEPLEAFPELARLPGKLRAEGLVLDGTLLVLDDDARPDPDLLRRRLERPYRRGGYPALIVDDLIYADGRPLAAPYVERREQLTLTLDESDWCMVGRGYRGEGAMLAIAVGALGIGSLSARRLDARYRRGHAGDAWLRVPIAPSHVAAGARPSLALILKLGL